MWACRRTPGRMLATHGQPVRVATGRYRKVYGVASGPFNSLSRSVPGKPYVADPPGRGPAASPLPLDSITRPLGPARVAGPDHDRPLHALVVLAVVAVRPGCLERHTVRRAGGDVAGVELVI